MIDKNLQKPEPERWRPHPNLLPFIFETESEILKLEGEEKEKVEQFENKLEGALKPTDTIDEAIKKMVKTALGVEFGENLVKDKAAFDMINTITHGILGDPQLRRQALIIVDKYTSQNKLEEIKEAEKRKKKEPSSPEIQLY